MDPYWMPVVEPPDDWTSVWEEVIELKYNSSEGSFIKTPDKEFLRNLNTKHLER